MSTSEIRLERLTRREFRQALDDGHFQVAILATGSIEQHNEHLALGQDIFSSTHVAELAARQEQQAAGQKPPVKPVLRHGT